MKRLKDKNISKQAGRKVDKQTCKGVDDIKINFFTPFTQFKKFIKYQLQIIIFSNPKQ